MVSAGCGLLYGKTAKAWKAPLSRSSLQAAGSSTTACTMYCDQSRANTSRASSWGTENHTITALHSGCTALPVHGPTRAEDGIDGWSTTMNLVRWSQHAPRPVRGHLSLLKKEAAADFTCSAQPVRSMAVTAVSGARGNGGRPKAVGRGVSWGLASAAPHTRLGPKPGPPWWRRWSISDHLATTPDLRSTAPPRQSTAYSTSGSAPGPSSEGKRACTTRTVGRGASATAIDNTCTEIEESVRQPRRQLTCPPTPFSCSEARKYSPQICSKNQVQRAGFSYLQYPCSHWAGAGCART